MNLFNSGFVQQQAEAMAGRLEHVHADSNLQIQAAVELVYSRMPEADELVELQAFVAEQGLPALCRVLLNSNEFLFIP